MAERLHDSDGVLNDDRIRNTVIENHRRTTAAITATTSAIAAATAEFRRDAKRKLSKPYQHNQRQWRAYRKA